MMRYFSFCSLVVLCINAALADQSVYSVKTVAEFTWTTDDDAPRLSASQIYQMENAASTYFGELLEDMLEEDEEVDPLTTRVAISDQTVELTETGERLKFEVPSIVDFQYIGEKEIPSITDTLQKLTDESRGEPAFSNMEILAGARPASSFTITFSNTTTNASTLLYTVLQPTNDSNDGQTGLIIACTLATISLFLASLILLWAVGVFDGWKPCKNLRSRFYLPPLTGTPESPLPYGMTAKSTADETDVAAPDIHIGAAPMPTHDEENILQDQGIEMTPSRGIFRVDESDMLSPADSDDQTADISHVSSIAPLGIASMRKEKRHAAEARKCLPHAGTMSPESILADIASIHMDVD